MSATLKISYERVSVLCEEASKFVLHKIGDGSVNHGYIDHVKKKKAEVFVVGRTECGKLVLVAFLNYYRLKGRTRPCDFACDCGGVVRRAFREQPSAVLVVDLVVSSFGAVHLFIDTLVGRCSAFGLEYGAVVLESVQKHTAKMYASHGFRASRKLGKRYMFRFCRPVEDRLEAIVLDRRRSICEESVRLALEIYRRHGGDPDPEFMRKVPPKYRDLYFRGRLRIDVLADLDGRDVGDRDAFVDRVLKECRLPMLTNVQAYASIQDIVRKKATE